uniref:Uncharacterized protein n=1 Tax=Timema shepardi TaxID=629360 RepID=A0A7R9G7X2_TIMSH|nr:unnamed protein product [Timema shepardi]
MSFREHKARRMQQEEQDLAQAEELIKSLGLDGNKTSEAARKIQAAFRSHGVKNMQSEEMYLATQHTLSKKRLPSNITPEPALREKQCSLYLSVPPSSPPPSYLRMRTTVKHHVAGTVERKV